jgi:putative ABC transport system ATP-binding protein
MIKLENVTKVHRASEVETTALDGISLHIGAGEFAAILGPSGCGKSTLLSILGMLDQPTAGDYLFAGESMRNRSEAELSRYRRGRLGFVFQNFNLIDELTVAENVAMALDYLGIDNNEKRRRVEEALERLNIAHRADHRPSQLSGGQQQRVAIARALICRPSLVLADEPAGNLDSSHGRDVMSLLSELNKSGTTVVMVTHSEEHAAWAPRQISLLDGRVVSDVQSAAGAN